MKPSRAKTPGRTPGIRTPQVGRTPIRPPARPAVRRVISEESYKDPVEVFCRVRPVGDESEGNCIETEANAVKLTPPITSRAYQSGKETKYSFKGVFGEDVVQKNCFDRVGLPLVDDLLKGKNGLLFTYGVTGSGKTYTMQGSPQDGGIMPRCVDVIFNSIGEMQTRKFQLKADKLNGYETLSEADAALERQQEMIQNMRQPKNKRNNTSGDPNLSNRVADQDKVEAVDEDQLYSVFISYVEIYNNYIYDLLEPTALDIVTGKQKMPSKILREDSFRNMYVHGVTEVEVKSPEEAMAAFYRGQTKRSVAQTQLNTESSRSHSVFNIRVVAAPLDPLGEEILQDPRALTISQLALVDLAGSERTNRTGNTGALLAEASKINQSLMTLRKCIEVLRENQANGTDNNVPFRESRITHLFRNYFEGEGKVKMIVCVNPRAADYDENVNVMKFAELTQEVQIERALGVRFDLGLTPGRRRANQVYKEAVRRMEENGVDTAGLVMDLAPVYSLGGPWPPVELGQCDNEEVIENLQRFLEKRIATRATLMQDHETKQEQFRALLAKHDQDVVLCRAENKQLKVQLDAERNKTRNLEARLGNAESANRSLTTKVNAYQDMKLVLENDLDEKELQINQEQVERQRVAKKYRAKVDNEREKLEGELNKKLELQRNKLKQKSSRNEDKMKAIKALINCDETDNDENVENGARRHNSNPDLSILQPRGRNVFKTNRSDPRLSGIQGIATPARKSAAVVNPRHRRSRSTDADMWLDHTPSRGAVPLNTVLQPALKKRRSVTRLQEKDIVNSKTSKYLLTTQNQDSDGGLETRLYKGDVLPTAGGGRQVVFNDVEVLTQTSPTTESPRKRSYEVFEAASIGARIANLQERGVEGQPTTPGQERVTKRSKRL